MTKTGVAMLAVLFVLTARALDWLNHSGLSDIKIAIWTILIFSACVIAAGEVRYRSKVHSDRGKAQT